MSRFGRSNRWSTFNFSYTCNVPQNGEYDVTLVFAETDEGNFAPGKRVFNAVVRGTNSFEFNNIDVFKRVGARTAYKINIHNVQTNDSILPYSIKVDLKKGVGGNPFISGIVIGAVENEADTVPRPPVEEPSVLIPQEQYDDCMKKRSTRTSPPLRVRLRPPYETSHSSCFTAVAIPCVVSS